MEDSEDPAADAAWLLFCWYWSGAPAGNGSLALNLRDEFRSCNIHIAIREHLQATWVKVAERTTNNQILFNLPEVRPGSARRPLLDMCKWNHESISTGTLTMSFQSVFRSLFPASSGTMGLTDGSRGLKDFAFSANGRNALACFKCPNRSKR